MKPGEFNAAHSTPEADGNAERERAGEPIGDQPHPGQQLQGFELGCEPIRQAPEGELGPRSGQLASELPDQRRVDLVLESRHQPASNNTGYRLRRSSQSAPGAVKRSKR